MQLEILTKKPYKIVVENSFLLLTDEAKKVIRGNNILIVTDRTVEPLYLNEVKSCFKDYRVFTFVIESGEQQKNVTNYINIISFLADNKFHRDDTIIALGGGVVGDLAGFVGATYMRGITLIQCPTTLLASVDSSVGGKTAIDLAQGKNLVGAFYQPSLTYINLSTLSTLPDREIKCGLGEVVKYAFIDKSVNVELLEKGITDRLILECVKIKAKIVEEDEFDFGKRALLNLGHTIGHAIEKLSNFSLSHGSAVVKGIGAIINISCKYYGFSQDKRTEMLNVLSYSKEDISIGYSKEQILEQIIFDKKSFKDGINFVLIKDVGDCEIVKLTIEEVKRLFI